MIYPLHMRPRALLILCLWLISSFHYAHALQQTAPASPYADALDEARMLFNKGEYDQAQMAAKLIGSSEGYVLASEALAAKIILAHYDKPNKPSKQAREFAEKALALNPDNVEAHIQYAVSFGLETQSTGVLKAWRKRMPSRMLKIIETLQDIAPNNPRSHALMGAWHLGIVNRVGKRNAKAWYNANAEDGMAHYHKALALSENDIIIISNYATSIIVLGNPDYAKKYIVSLENIKGNNAAEETIRRRVLSLLALYDQPKALKRAAKNFLNNRPISA